MKNHLIIPPKGSTWTHRLECSTSKMARVIITSEDEMLIVSQILFGVPEGTLSKREDRLAGAWLKRIHSTLSADGRTVNMRSINQLGIIQLQNPPENENHKN